MLNDDARWQPHHGMAVAALRLSGGSRELCRGATEQSARHRRDGRPCGAVCRGTDAVGRDILSCIIAATRPITRSRLLAALMTEPVLQIRGLTKHFPVKRAEHPFLAPRTPKLAPCSG